MNALLLIILGAIIALAAAWFFYVRDLKEEVDRNFVKFKQANAAIQDVKTRITACWNVSFASFGTPPDAANTLFDSLWDFAGQEKRGAPKIK